MLYLLNFPDKAKYTGLFISVFEVEITNWPWISPQITSKIVNYQAVISGNHQATDIAGADWLFVFVNTEILKKIKIKFSLFLYVQKETNDEVTEPS